MVAVASDLAAPCVRFGFTPSETAITAGVPEVGSKVEVGENTGLVGSSFHPCQPGALCRVLVDIADCHLHLAQALLDCSSKPCRHFRKARLDFEQPHLQAQVAAEAWAGGKSTVGLV